MVNWDDGEGKIFGLAPRRAEIYRRAMGATVERYFGGVLNLVQALDLQPLRKANVLSFKGDNT